MTEKKILITDKVHPLLVDGLRKCGCLVEYHPHMPYDIVRANVSKYNGIVINSKVVCDRSFLDQAGHLDFIGRLGSGLDIIDLPHAASKGIQVISSPEGNANAVAEHALGMLLSLMHHLGRSHEDVRQLQWNREPNRGEELKGKTVGIIGFGHTGPALARKLSQCEVQIKVYDKYRSDIGDHHPYIIPASLEDVLITSDILSIHLPLTSETQNLVNKELLARCKQGVILINTSRGSIVNSKDLLEMIERGHVGGACLDVLENEVPNTWSALQKNTYEALLQRKDVIITPHIAGWTHQSLKLIASILLDKIVAFYHKSINK